MGDDGYRAALLDWLACAYAGCDEPAPSAARDAASGLEGDIAAAGAAGHVLDYDDTYLPGLAHLSAPTAPVACLLGAEAGASIGAAVDAYAAGFEAMGAFARAGHPVLYERGWHPTSVCGTVGAAITACEVLDLQGPARSAALALALTSSSGLQGSFGSHGKALQVGAAAAAGLRAARLARAGARASLERVVEGFERAYGVVWTEPGDGPRAIDDNWIKAYPCCLQTHSSIEAAERARAEGVRGGPVRVVIHPLSRRAAPYDDVSDGLQAKFSIPYTVAHALLRRPPTVSDFAAVDPAVAAAAEQVTVETDPALMESEARLVAGDVEVRVDAARGSPQHPMSPEQLSAKVDELSGDALAGILDDLGRPAALLTAAARLGRVTTIR